MAINMFYSVCQYITKLKQYVWGNPSSQESAAEEQDVQNIENMKKDEDKDEEWEKIITAFLLTVNDNEDQNTDENKFSEQDNPSKDVVSEEVDPERKISITEALEERTVKEIPEGDKEPDFDKEESTLSFFVIPKTEPRPEVSIEPMLEDYEHIPVGASENATLRGMSLNPDKGIGKTQSVASTEDCLLRRRKLGIGSYKEQALRATRVETRKEENLEIVKGSFIEVASGYRRGQYGQVEGFDDDAGRVIIKMTMEDSPITLSKLAIKLVTRKDYEKNANILSIKEPANDKEESTFSCFVTPKTEPRPEVSIEPMLEDYEHIPVGASENATLRGMSLNPDKGIGKTQSVASTEGRVLRPRKLGICSYKEQALRATRGETRKEEKLEIVKGAFIEVASGYRRGQYGQVEGFDDDAGRVIIKMTMEDSPITLSKLAIKLVTRKDYEKNANILSIKEPANDKEESTFSCFVTPKTEPRPEVSIEPMLEDYEHIPVGASENATLRGMSLNPDKGIGKTQSVASTEGRVLRPRKLGICSYKEQALRATRGETRKEEKLEIVKGAFIEVASGYRRGQYGQIEGFDDDAGRVIIKMAMEDSPITLSKLAIKLVTKKDYEKNANYLDVTKYEEYKPKTKETAVSKRVRTRSETRSKRKQQSSSSPVKEKQRTSSVSTGRKKCEKRSMRGH